MTAAGSNFLVPAAGFGAFFLIFTVLMVVGFGGFVLGVVALIDVSQTPVERFGPWWDNTKQTWIIGLAVAFVVPLGPLIGGIAWYRSGKPALRATGVAGRPFWAGAPRPAPPYQPQPPPPPPAPR
jgi:hypothetical protein